MPLAACQPTVTVPPLGVMTGVPGVPGSPKGVTWFDGEDHAEGAPWFGTARTCAV